MKALAIYVVGVFSFIALTGFLNNHFLKRSSTIDDTAALQALLKQGNVTLPANHVPYLISNTLVVNHSFNLNGNTIIFSSIKGSAIQLVSGGSISNGTINGTWNCTTAANQPAYSGIQMAADNTSVTRIHLSQFSSYGIVCRAYNHLSVTNCTIDKIGYIAFFFDGETAMTTGGIFSNNVVDRSMIASSTIQQPAIGIMGSFSNPNITTSGWTVKSNTIKMPVSPFNNTAECIELRYTNNCVISNNMLFGGSVSISSVKSARNTVSGNKSNDSELEGIEFADCQSIISQDNVIANSAGVGVLMDGAVGCTGIQIIRDTIRGTKNECIHAYTNTQNISITNCNLTANSQKAVNLQGTTGVNITGTTFNGNGVGAMAVFMDTCPGNLTINGGTISNYTKCVVYISNATSGLVTNNVTMSGVTVTGVPTALKTYLTNGAAVGTNIKVQMQ